MNRKHLLRALGDIDADLIERSEPGAAQRKRSVILRLTAAAAAILLLAALAVGGAVIASRKNAAKTPAAPSQPVEESESEESSLPDEKIHSGGLIFAVNPDGQTCALVGVEEDVDEIVIPESVDGYNVTEIKDFDTIIRPIIHLCKFDNNFVISGNTAYKIPIQNGNFVIGDDHPDLIAENGCLLDVRTGTLLKVMPGAVLPDNGSVRVIGDCAFLGIDGPEKVSVPEGVERIGDYAFMNCSAIKDLSLPATLLSIGEDAFFGCAELRRVDIPTRETWSGIDFFANTSNPLFAGAKLYINGVEQVPAAEPDKAADPDAWIAWLKDSVLFTGSKYPMLSGGAIYPVRKTAEMPYTGWDFFKGSFHLNYVFTNAEEFSLYIGEDYPYKWEIFYKKAGTEESFRSVVTEPNDVYCFLGEKPIIFRLPTYQSGMTDLETDGGKAQNYDFVFVISEKKTGEIVGWYADTLEINGSYEDFLADAKAAGAVK
jgi:hypothetical protein